jgi:hypothetical protein
VQQGYLDVEYVAIPVRTKHSNIDHAELKYMYDDNNKCNMNECDKFSIVYETSYASGTQCDTDSCDSYRIHIPVEKVKELVPADMASSDNAVCNGSDKEIYPYGTQAFMPQLKEDHDVSPVLNDKSGTPESMGFTPKLEIEDNLDANNLSISMDFPHDEDNENTSVNTVKTHPGREQIEPDRIEVQQLDDTLHEDITDKVEEMIHGSFKAPNAPKEDNELSNEHANQSFDLSQLLNISASEVQNSGVYSESIGTEDNEQTSRRHRFSFGDIFSPTQSADTVESSFYIKENKVAIRMTTEEKNRHGSMCYECNNSMNSQDVIYDVDVTSDNAVGMEANEVPVTLDNDECMEANKETAKGLRGTESWTDSPWQLSDSAIAEADSLVEKYGDNITSSEEKVNYDCSEVVGATGDRAGESVNANILQGDTGNAEVYNAEKIAGNGK